ncbi:MAG: hypothetical protein JNL63_08905 [Bacteroidia bacterium]|nr:hypothetical protein [Bacteroidia bacterium]
MLAYIDLFGELGKNKIRYLVCGGVAIGLHGIPRMTADIDILLDLEKENIEKFEKTIMRFGYLPLAPIPLSNLINESERLRLKKEKNLIAYSYQSGSSNLMSIDVLIDSPISFKQMWGNKIVRKHSDVEVNVVSVDDLIELKKYSNRLQDQDDIINLKKYRDEKGREFR